MATAPNWITSPNLGAYLETYSFDINPIIVEYFAVEPASVSQINGSLPSGLRWSAGNGNLTVSGESAEIFTPTHSRITWRITDAYGVIADRTYDITIDPILIAPDWAGQPQFLGYAASGITSTYSVSAHSSSGIPITYSIAAFAPPTGIQLNSSNGYISYSAPVVYSDQTTAFTVRATTASVYSDLQVNIALLTVPHAPAWITHSGLVGMVLEGSFVEIDLQAFDSSGAAISYTLVSSSPAFPFTLDSSGLVYGPAPTLYNTTVYQFTVAATSVNGSSSRNFDIIVSPVTIGSQLYWNSSANLGQITDGAFVTLDCSATSSRGTINYSLVGGILPRGLVLNTNGGCITGFAEFQTRDRSYQFDVSASDSVQTITRQFSLTIDRGVNYQYMGMTIPLEGNLKDSYYQYIGDTITQNSWIPNGSSTPQSILYPPYVQLIQGLNYAVDTPAAAVYFANLHLNTTALMVGATTNVNVSAATTLFYSPILDADAGAAQQYAQSDNLAQAASATLNIARGPATFTLDGASADWLAMVIPGTELRATTINDPTTYMQGPVTMFAGLKTTVSINVTLISGSGTYSQWLIYLAPIYPPNLVNIRSDLIAGLGWVSDGQGANAQLIPLVDPTTGSVRGADIVNPGSGYLYGPGLSVIGSGNGAVLGANLTILGTTVLSGGNAWAIGDQLQLTIAGQNPAQLLVSAVDQYGGIQSLAITDGGEYTIFPAGVQLLTNGLGAPARVTFDLGIGNVWVGSGGSNYAVSGTTISTAGSELLPSWQTTWQPYLNMGTVFTQYSGKVVGNEDSQAQQSIWYKRWPLQHAILELQGINWIGDTTFDQTSTCFDGGSTFWGEWLEPRDTLLDRDLTVFDQTNTRFDDDYALWQDYAYYAWGRTLFDQEYTIFDLYSTIFDSGPTPTRSLTLLRRLLRIVSQEISGHNVVV